MVPFIKKFDIPKEIFVDIQNNVAIFSNFGLKISVDIAKPFKASFFKEGVMIITCPINSLTCRKRDLRFLSPMFGSLKVKINQAISGILSGVKQTRNCASWSRGSPPLNNNFSVSASG